MIRFLTRYNMWVLFSGVFLGLAFPDLAKLLAPALAPTVVALLALSLIRLAPEDVLAVLRRPTVIAALLIWQLIVCPILALGALALLPLPKSLATAIVLAAACPPIMSAITFALIFRLNAALVTVQVIGSVLLVPITLPPLALLLLGLELPVSTGVLMGTLAGLTGTAFAGALLVRAVVPLARINAAADMLDLFGMLMLLIFAIAIMDGVTAVMIARPGFIGLMVLAAFASNLTLQALTFGAFRWLGRQPAKAVAIAAGNRNMGLLLAALAGKVAPDILLFFAVGQLPIYMLPLLLQRFYRASEPGD